MSYQQNYDALVIGSGLAGLFVALNLANTKRKVCIITKKSLFECNSYYAQGGIAGVIDELDSIENHIRDTIIAGSGLCDPKAVEYIVSHGRDAIYSLIDLGVEFTKDDTHPTGFHITREGGHSLRRILHVADKTGAEIITKLVSKVIAHPNITVLENSIAIDLILNDTHNKCVGAYVFNSKNNHTITISATNIILATGGASKVYLYTTNPDTATGDGIAMAYRSGCNVINMEFIQFHPTCLYHPHAKSFLISEALRGEGGILKLPNGYRFMKDHDHRLELAPRDIVARAIDFEMKKHGLDCVYLDISHKSASFIIEHFPTIYTTCKNFNIDITSAPIPVVPSAHYTCGGIETDLSGKTNISNLYAIGECASTGLHGANRLASNSLLECVVMGNAAVTDILNRQNINNHITLPQWDDSQVVDSDEEVIVSHNWDELRRMMWSYVGIVRTNKRLERALHRVELLEKEIKDYYANFKLSLNLIELRNLVCVAKLVIESAMLRHENIGLHYSADYKNTQSNNYPINTVLNKEQKA